MIKGETSMKQNIIYVGLDVDDTQYHGSALDKNTGEVNTFKCRPNEKWTHLAHSFSQDLGDW